MKSAHWAEDVTWDWKMRQINSIITSGSSFYRAIYSHGRAGQTIWKHSQLHSAPLRGHGDSFLVNLR